METPSGRRLLGGGHALHLCSHRGIHHFSEPEAAPPPGAGRIADIHGQALAALLERSAEMLHADSADLVNGLRAHLEEKKRGGVGGGEVGGEACHRCGRAVSRLQVKPSATWAARGGCVGSAAG